MHPNVAAIDAILEANGLAGRVRLLPEAAPTATAAAAQLGVETAAIANSLIFATQEGEPVLIMMSGAHRVDTTKAAALLNTAALHRASPELVYTATMQRIGGVAPVGHPSRLRALVDNELAAYSQIWAAGGIAHAVFPTTFAELVMLTGGAPADLT